MKPKEVMGASVCLPQAPVEGSLIRPELSPSRRLALRGMGLFVEASQKTPALVEAQGAVIALRCLQQNLDPSKLKDAVLADEDVLERILVKALEAHEKSNNPKAYKWIPHERVVDIVRSDFYTAETLMESPIEDLYWIQKDLYEAFRAGTLKRDEIKKMIAERMLMRKRELATLISSQFSLL